MNKENLKWYIQNMVDSFDKIPTEWVSELWAANECFLEPLTLDEDGEAVYDLGIWGWCFLLPSYWSEKIEDHINEINEQLPNLNVFGTDRGILLSPKSCGYNFYEGLWDVLYEILN